MNYLQLGDEMEHYSNLFKSADEIDKGGDSDVLLHYNTDNAEVFSQQISQINDRNIC